MDKPKALTIKELKTMIGKPVFVVREGRKEWCLVHSFHLSEVYGGGIIVTTRTSQKKTLPYHEFCISWCAYDKEVRCADYCKRCVFRPETDTVTVMKCWQCMHSDMIGNTRYCFHWGRNTDDDGYCHEGVC